MNERYRRRFALALLCLGCDEVANKPSSPQAIEPSPNASILPAPLVTDLESARSTAAVDAGARLDASSDAGAAERRVLREDRPVSPDSALKESAGVRFLAQWHWLDLPSVPRLPEANVEATGRLRQSMAFELSLELHASGRLRAVFESDSFVLPRGTELRARADYLGHFLVWDTAETYAVLPPGTLRAVLTEHRSDAAPLIKPRVTEVGIGNVLGLPTIKRELVTPLGRLLVEQASLPSAGGAGELVCRLLAEFIAASPDNAACSKPQVVVRAEIFSHGGGHVLFDVRRIDREQALDPTAALAPPEKARFTQAALPSMGPTIVPSASRLRELRQRAVPRAEKAEANAPRQGLLVQNRTESLRFVLLDGVVLARVTPRRDVLVDQLVEGRYAISSLDFLADDATPLRFVDLPARIVLGEEPEPAK